MAKKKKKRNITVEDVYSEVKRLDKKGYFTGTKSEIDKQSERIRKLENSAKYLRREKNKLSGIQKLYTTPRAKRHEIEEKIESIDIKLKDINLPSERNYLKMLKGDDFYHVIDNGFTQTRIKHSELKNSPGIAEDIVDKYISDIKDAIVITDRKLSGKLDKAVRLREEKRKKALNKILKIANLNKQAIEDDTMDELDVDDEKRYPFLILVVGDKITVNA